MYPPVSSAEQSQEIAARALLGEAEKLIELALPQEALPVLDKVRADYPSTEAVPLLQEIADGTPTSGYAASALYCLGTRSASHPEAAMAALSRLSEGSYDPNWRGLAYWRLASLHRMRHEDAEARRCYTEAISIFQERITGQATEIGDWQSMLRHRIGILQSELRSVEEGGAR